MKASSRRPLRFTQLRLQNWRNFTSVDVALSSRVFLVGPNASGKSNLLDAFRFLAELSAESGGLHYAVSDRRHGFSRVRCLAARAKPGVVVSVDVGDDANPKAWSYELVLDKLGGAHDEAKVVRELVRKDGKPILERPDAEDRADPDRCKQTAVEQVGANREFRDLVEFFRSIRYLHVVPQMLRHPERLRPLERPRDPFGTDLLETMNALPTKSRDARLERIAKAVRKVVPQLGTLELKTDSRGVPHLEARYQHWRRHGAKQTEADLSDGTLRLVGLLWSLLERNGPLLLEEPELSLHSAVVRRLPDLLAMVASRSGRQVLLSTHSSDLLDGEGIGLNEVILLRPGKGGEATKVGPISELEEVRSLLEGGIPLSDIANRHTTPPNAHQPLLPFDDGRSEP